MGSDEDKIAHNKRRSIMIGFLFVFMQMALCQHYISVNKLLPIIAAGDDLLHQPLSLMVQVTVSDLCHDIGLVLVV